MRLLRLLKPFFCFQSQLLEAIRVFLFSALEINADGLIDDCSCLFDGLCSVFDGSRWQHSFSFHNLERFKLHLGSAIQSDQRIVDVGFHGLMPLFNMIELAYNVKIIGRN